MADWKTAIVNEQGERLAVFADPRAAYDWAIRQGFEEVYAEEFLRDRLPNPTGFFAGRRPVQNPLGEKGPARAWAQLGNLRIRWADVERVTLAEAYRRIIGLRIPKVVGGGLSSRNERLWPVKRRRAGTIEDVQRWLSAEGMGEHVLQDNDKLAKRHPAQPSRVAGLSLLPAYEPSKLLLGRVPILQPGTSFCVGSNEECRDSCLVFSGRNEIDRYNRVVKRAKTGALLSDPVAFGRVLYENCKNWLGRWPAGHGTLQPFVRLNVFSDIPWELVFPELFTRLPDLMFYDYTKVPARPEMAQEIQRNAGVSVFRYPQNYDLTFSASGTNDRDAYGEYRRGRRVAVVFETKKHVVPQWYEAAFLPVTLPVVDGDESDLRPFDPDGRALERAREELGPWTMDMTEKQRKAHLRRTTKLAFKYTFGRRAPHRYEDYPRRGPVLVGLTYKPPVLTEHRAVAEAAQAKGRERERRSSTKRAFMVSVIERGNMIVAPGCQKTVTFSSPVIPAAQPGVLALERDEEEILVAAKPARKKGKKKPKTKAKKKSTKKKAKKTAEKKTATRRKR